MPLLCGGAGSPKDATPEVQSICDEMKPHAEDKAGKGFDVFSAKSFTTQVVQGTNFFIKVHVGGDEYVHLRVHKPLPFTNKPLELHSIQTDKAHDEAVGYF